MRSRIQLLSKMKAIEYAILFNDVNTIREIIEEVSYNTADMLRLRTLYRTNPDEFIKIVKERYKNSLKYR